MADALIPFQDFAAEVKPLLSGFNVSFELENAMSSFLNARNDIKDVVGKAIWDLMIAHYNSADYSTDYIYDEGEGEEEGDDPDIIRLNKLVFYCQGPLANFAMNRHFIWLMLRVSNDGVTVKKSDSETTAFKYLQDEAKSALIENACAGINDLIEFLDEEATPWSLFAANTAYAQDQLIYHTSKFYKAKVAFTSGNTFNVSDWTEVQPSDVVFHEWTLSEQYAAWKQMLIDYKSFNGIYNINNSAYFFIRCRQFISEIILEEIRPRVDDIDNLVARIQSGTLTTNDNLLLLKIRRPIVYAVLAKAVYQFALFELPATLQSFVANEFKSISKDQSESFIKKNISDTFHIQADRYLTELSDYLTFLDNDPAYDTETEKNVTEPKFIQSEDDTFLFSGV